MHNVHNLEDLLKMYTGNKTKSKYMSIGKNILSKTNILCISQAKENIKNIKKYLKKH